jgi:hypothetical protein
MASAFATSTSCSSSARGTSAQAFGWLGRPEALCVITPIDHELPQAVRATALARDMRQTAERGPVG